MSLHQDIEDTLLDLGYDLDPTRFSGSTGAECNEQAVALAGTTIEQLAQSMGIISQDDPDYDWADEGISYRFFYEEPGTDYIDLGDWSNHSSEMSFNPWAIVQGIKWLRTDQDRSERLVITKGMVVAFAMFVFWHEYRHSQNVNQQMRDIANMKGYNHVTHDSYEFEQDADAYAFCILLDVLGLTA